MKESNSTFFFLCFWRILIKNDSKITTHGAVGGQGF